jgi:prolyl-tRNA editing enzyme YbaK/EbsC (Cys-tRNA(Pro) deacylase)
MKKFQNDNTKTGSQVANKGFHFRLANHEEALALTGYEFNAITPFLINAEAKNLPILLSEDIALLQPAYLWFSGGRIQIKMGVSVADF